MKSAKCPPNEAQRLEALEALNILDSLPEADFDQITQLASAICDTPIALISVVDKTRQWFKSKVGIEASQTDRELAFCAHAILQDDVFVVEDASKDERFFDNPLVTGAPHVQFYAGAPLLSPDGFPIGTVCVIDNQARNLTPVQISSLKALSNQVTRLLELRSKIENLEFSEKQLKFILDSVPHMIGTWDSNFLNRNANHVYSNFFGRGPEEIRGQHMRDVLGEEVYQKNLPYLRQVLKGNPVNFERAFPHKDGTTHHMLVSYIPQFSGKKVIGFLAVTVDVTDLKNLEKQRQKLEIQLAQSARLSALGEMAGGVAHEINNPLTIIRGKTELLKRRFETGQIQIESALRDFQMIETTVDRIAKIIKGLRTYSRDAERDPFEAVSIHSILEDTIGLCGEKFRAGQIELRVHCSPTLVIECRAAQISQVLMNLFINSNDAIANLAEKWIEVDVRDEGERVHIFVRDSGSGIESSAVDKIMQPFFTTKPVGKGTGLGLSISLGIAESHGGTLKCLTDQKNTTFVLTLPVVQPKVKNKAA